MSSDSDLAQLKTRITSVLKSQTCQKIRFQIDNISIQTFMYAYVGDLVKNGFIHVDLGDGDDYDHRSNNMHVNAANVPAKSIVHEATHAAIDATNPGKDVTKGTHEAAAYLAESVYALLSGDEPDTDRRYLTPPVAELARAVVAFNSTHPSGLYECPVSQVSYIKKILGLTMDVDRVDRQDGVPYQSGGLIRRMILDSK